MNLVRNACEAAERQDAPTVTIRTSRHGQELCFEVEDNGAGLDLKQAGSLFDSEASSKPGGMGIGLAISRTILETHGSAIKGENRRSGGARFSFNLNCSESRAASAEARHKSLSSARIGLPADMISTPASPRRIRQHLPLNHLTDS
jgi:signal transduction histidine kinase